MTKINTIEELKKDCIKNDGCGEFFIMLNGGMRSSKTIYFEEDGDDFDVIHEIDFSDETLDEEGITSSFIGEAIVKGAFYSYN
jgi:hypothetical protein